MFNLMQLLYTHVVKILSSKNLPYGDSAEVNIHS